MLNKPMGIVTTNSDEFDRQTVRDLIPIEGHLYPVGRLDADSEGLVLLTNDGDLANALTHPRYEHEKEYVVLVEGQPAAGTLKAWRHGVLLEERNVEERAKFHLHMAKLYAQASRNDLSLQYLRKALEEGFKDKKKIEEDPDFKAMRELPEFKELLALEPRVL